MAERLSQVLTAIASAVTRATLLTPMNHLDRKQHILHLPQVPVSQHLAYLRKAGWVESGRQAQMESLSPFTLAIPWTACRSGWTLERGQDADVAPFGLGTHGSHPEGSALLFLLRLRHTPAASQEKHRPDKK